MEKPSQERVLWKHILEKVLKVLAVNVMSQEDGIYKPLLKIFQTACMWRSLLAGEFLVWTSLCKASSKVQAVVARKQEG